VVPAERRLTFVSDGLDHGIDRVALQGVPHPYEVIVGQAEVVCWHRTTVSWSLRALSEVRNCQRLDLQ
jgi:hypothetical protein